MAYHSSILNCWGGKNCAGADPRFSFWQLQVYPSTDPRRCRVCCVCVCACPCVRRTGVGNPEVSPDAAGTPRQRDDWRLQMTERWMSFVLPVLFASFIPRVQLWTGSVAMVRWCNGWPLLARCATAASIWSSQRVSDTVWVKKQN